MKKIIDKVISFFITKSSFVGFIDELNNSYVCGWICDENFPDKRLVCEVVLLTTDEVIASTIASNLHYETIKMIGDGSCRYAFFVNFPRILTPKEQKQVVIRVKDTNFHIPLASNVKTEFQPFLHMAMDIVNNCNLRCPFCLYDYSSTKKTFFMSEEIIDVSLRFLPFVPDGDFWFSCLHEPTLHPKLVDYLKKIPKQYRQKVFFTTNLAKRMSNDFFEWVTNSGLHHINISLESFDSEIYEKLRNGAKQHIFLENMNKFKIAFQDSNKPIEIRYIIMAYQSNLKELPALCNILIYHYNASLIEIRSSFDTPFISSDFKEKEFLKDNDWVELEKKLEWFLNNKKVVILRELITEESKDRNVQEDILSGRYMLRLSWDGSLKVFVYEFSSKLNKRVEKNILETNVKNITDINSFYNKLIKISNGLISIN